MYLKDIPTDVRSFKRDLGQLFPHDHSLSPAMWRLAIIRDDLQHELHRSATGATSGAENDDEEKQWEFTYFIRRLCVSLLEAKNVFENEIRKLIKERKRRPSPQFVLSLEEAFKSVAAVAPLVEPLRNSLGGHVRPNHANPDRNTEPFDVRGLRTHARWPGTVGVDVLHGVGTTYRSLTKMSFLFAWPEVTNGSELMEKADSFHEPVARAAIVAMKAIDGILCAFWQDIGAIGPTDLGSAPKSLLFK